jgi:hypothetical protein
VPKATPTLAAPSWGRAATKVISMLEVLISGDVAQWTHVTSSFVGHRNIYKSQRTVMTL